MIELRALPLRGVVTEGAVLREARFGVIGIGRRVEIAQMTTHAFGPKSRKLPPNMA